MTAMVQRNQKGFHGFYRFFCLAVVMFGAAYRFLKKAAEGKYAKAVQSLFSLLAFLCLGGIVYFCASLERDGLSVMQAALLSALCLGGFGLFCDLAGAFRSYRDLKSRRQKKKIQAVPNGCKKLQKAA